MERTLNTANVARPLARVLSELVDGTPPTGGYMLNKSDVGLLKSLDRLTASEASEIIDGGSSIAAHVDHVLYYFDLMNRWAAGEQNPWKGADWKVSWTRTSVDENEWTQLRHRFADALSQWRLVVEQPRDVTGPELTGMISSVVHLGYHFGAIRQMDRKARGPSANNEVDAFTAPASRP